MKEKIENISTFYSHFLFWTLYYGTEFWIEVYSHIFTKTSILRFLLGIGLFYILLSTFRKNAPAIKIALFLLSFLLFLCASLIIKYGTINLDQKFTDPPISVQILYVIDNFAHLFFLALIFNIYKNLVESHKQAIFIENQLFEIETQYLNSKIDAHFFLNSINLFYAHFLKKDSNVAQELIKLSYFVKKNL